MLNFVKYILFVILIGALNIQAKIIKVPADHLTIQKAINSASNGDTVLVNPGTYFENINFKGKNIVVTSRFFETFELNFIKSTIINGGKPGNADSSSCVLIISGEDSTAVLQGFTITGGRGTKWVDEHGAGTYREGGGILIAKSSPTIRFNLIINNEAYDKTGVTSSGGGGIRAGDGNPRILNNIIAANKGRYGAGIVLNYTGAIVKNNIITENSGGQDYGGGALWMNHDGPSKKIIENNTIAGNKVISVYIWQGTSIIKNCIIWTDPPAAPVQIGIRSGSPMVTFSNVMGGYNGTGNISVDPQFTDTLFILKNTSPCIDAGYDTSEYNDPESSLSPGTAQFPSKGNLRNDMGAYGGAGTHSFPDYNISTAVGSLGNSLPSEYRLFQNYPNPFNPVTNIEYSIPSESFVSLKVYNILGKEIITLANEIKNAGYYKVSFYAVNLSSGVYFYTLKAGIYTSTKKLILLK